MNRVKFPLPQPIPDTPLRGEVFRHGDFNSVLLRRMAAQARKRSGSRWAVIKPKRVSQAVIWQGRPFYWGDKGYYRGGTGDRRPLQVLIWEKQNRRALPAGHEVFFRDRDRHNFTKSNLELLSKADCHRRIHALGETGRATFEVACRGRQRMWTRKSRERVSLLLKTFQGGDQKIGFLGTRKLTITHGPKT